MKWWILLLIIIMGFMFVNTQLQCKKEEKCNSTGCL